MPGLVRARVIVLALCGWSAVGSASPAQQGSVPTATTVIHFSPPSVLPGEAAAGSCIGPSRAARFRRDAWTCVAGSTTYDPCFTIATRTQVWSVWCVADPRQPGSGTLITVKSVIPTETEAPSPLVWFFELTDGSTCRPLTVPGRIVDGEREVYSCKYGSAGEADAVLGDLDSSAPVWTIHKVLINKKTEPQTIKSLAVASVRTVWR